MKLLNLTGAIAIDEKGEQYRIVYCSVEKVEMIHLEDKDGIISVSQDDLQNDYDICSENGIYVYHHPRSQK
jgi:hypothetical protein